MGALAAIGAATIALAGVVNATPASVTGIILLVGADESQRVVNWYASANTQQVVQVGPTSELLDGTFLNGATTYSAVVAANTANGGFNGHAILDHLEENTAYSYRVGGDGAWSATYAFKTRKFDGNFDFLFFGDPQTTTLVTAVKQWANAEYVRLETVGVTEPHRVVDGIVEAMDRRPDLVICAGNALVDALALVTASHLDQQFLVVGAQLPEPTVNVTAAIWQGASSRGREVPNTALSFDPDAFTPEHAGAAIRAGVASVLSDLTGIVIWLDAR